MLSLLNDRVTYVWLCLAFLTGVSWFLADGIAPTTSAGLTYLAVGLLALAFFKVRLVIMYFMEVLNAPRILRGLFETWVIVVFFAMCFIYLGGISG